MKLKNFPPQPKQEGVRLINNIPTDLQHLRNSSSFKRKLKEYGIQNKC